MTNVPDMLRVYIVEDDAAVRASLAYQMKTVGMASSVYRSAEEFLAEHTTAMEGCLLVDVRLPGMDGVKLIERLVSQGTRLTIVAISAFVDVPRIVAAMRAGAVDFLEKPLAPVTVLNAVRNAIQGSTTHASLRAEVARATPRVNALPSRERAVLEELAKGTSTKQIADSMGISPKTVDTYRANLMTKFGVATTYELVRLAVLVQLFSSPNI